MEQDYAIQLLNDLCSVINSNPMPISIKYFIIKDIFNETEMLYNQYRAEISKSMQVSEEKEETQEVTVPVEYTEEEIETLKKKQ